MKSRSRSCYVTANKAAGGCDPIDRRSGLGGHPGRTIPYGIPPPYNFALIQGRISALIRALRGPGRVIRRLTRHWHAVSADYGARSAKRRTVAPNPPYDGINNSY